MNKEFAWLPENGLVSGQTVTAVGKIVDGWAAHWFDASPLTVAACWVRQDGTVRADSAEWQAPLPLGEGLAVQHRIGSSEALKRALFAVPGQRTAHHPQDQRLLDTLAAKVTNDLHDRISSIAFKQTPAAGGARYELMLNDMANRPALRFIAETALLVLLAKEGVGPQRSLPPITRRIDAIADKSVTAAALIGRARLPYSDLLGLAVGDVLILDTCRDTPLDLMVEGAVAGQRVISSLASNSNSSPHFES